MKKVFFNYNPEAFLKCFFECLNLTNDNKKEYSYKYCFPPLYEPQGDYDGSEILKVIRNRHKVYYKEDVDQHIILYPIECGDCTSFSSNIKPSFWID